MNIIVIVFRSKYFQFVITNNVVSVISKNRNQFIFIRRVVLKTYLHIDLKNQASFISIQIQKTQKTTNIVGRFLSSEAAVSFEIQFFFG